VPAFFGGSEAHAVEPDFDSYFLHVISYSCAPRKPPVLPAF
jgi:hypothetical protein